MKHIYHITQEPHRVLATKVAPAVSIPRVGGEGG